MYTDQKLEIEEQDESYKRMNFLLGRYERSASEFYNEYVENNHLFQNEPIKKMSKLTKNLLHGIDYDFIKEKRTRNFAYLHDQLREINKLSLTIPEGAYMYPLYVEDGTRIRKELQKEKIYIPTLWPAVFNICREDELEYDLAKNILPLPVDQRYSIQEMDYLVKEILKCIN